MCGVFFKNRASACSTLSSSRTSEETSLFLPKCCYASSFLQLDQRRVWSLTRCASHEKVGDCTKGQAGDTISKRSEDVNDFCSAVLYLEVMRWHFDLELVSLKENAEFNPTTAHRLKLQACDDFLWSLILIFTLLLISDCSRSDMDMD